MKGAPLVISGAPRSGTTLIYNLMDGHSDISWLVTEAYFFEYLHDLGVEREAVYRLLADAGIDSLIDGLRDRSVIPPLHNSYRQVFPGTMETAVTYEVPWDEEAFRVALQSVDFSTISSMWKGIARACLQAMGQAERRYVCLKAADYGKSAFASIATIEDARAILILRNPVLAIDSLKYGRAKRNDKRLTWPTLATHIGQYVRMFEAAAKLADEPKLYIIRYEDLAAEPGAEMRRIAAWLDIAFEPALIEPTFLGRSWTGHSTQRVTSGVDSELAVREPKYLTRREQDVIRDALSEGMSRWGYA
jgi:hypothetical protein